MIRLKLTCLTLFIVTVLSVDVVAKKSIDIESAFTNVEKKYLTGDYKNGIVDTRALITLTNTKFGGKSFMIARAYTWYARYALVLGSLNEYNSNLENAVKIIGAADKANSNDYAKALVDLTNTYLAYQEYAKAEQYITQAKELVEQNKIADRGVLYSINYSELQVKFNQGFLNRILPTFAPLQKEALARIVKFETYVDAKGKTKKLKLSKTEQSIRKRNYANLCNLQAEVFIENGEKDSAKVALRKNSAWIRKNLKSAEGALSYTLYLQSLLDLDDDNLNAANIKLEEAETKAGKYYKIQAEAYTTIYELLITNLKELNKDKSAQSATKKLDKALKSYFGEKSLQYQKLTILNIKKDIIEGELVKADKRLNAFLYSGALPRDHIRRVEIMMMFYDIHMAAERYAKAERAMKLAIDLKKSKHGEKSPAYHMLLLKIANHDVIYLDKYKDAEDLYSKSLDSIVKIEVGHKQKDYAGILYQRANLYEITDRLETAYSMIKEASDEMGVLFGTNSIPYAISLERFASIDIAIGKYKEAETNLNNALKIFKEKGRKRDRLDQAHTLETKARLLIILGDFETAKSVLKDAYKLTKRSSEGGTVNASSAIEEAAYLDIYYGKYQETEERLLAILAFRESSFSKKHRSLINPLNQLGFLKLTTGNYSEAEKYITRAASISKSILGEKSVKYSESLKLLENLYFAEGDYEKANTTGEKVVDIQIAIYGKNHLKVAMSLNDLALAKHYDKKSKTEVERLFLESLETIKGNLDDNNPSYAEVLENMAIFYMETGAPNKASDIIEKANKIWISRLGEQNKHTARIYFIKGNIQYYYNNFEEAKTNFLKSKKIFLELFDENHPEYVEALGKSAQMYYNLGDIKNAVAGAEETVVKSELYLNKIFPTLSDKGKAKYWEKVRGDFEFYKTLAFTQHESYPDMIGNVYNFTMRTKSILMNSSIKVRESILKSKDSTLIKKYQKWLLKKEMLTSSYSLSAAQRKESGLDIVKLEAEIEELEKSLNESSDLFAQNYEKTSIYEWRELKKLLPQNSIAIEIVPFQWYNKGFTDTTWYAFMSVSPDTKRNPEFTLAKNGAELEVKYIKYYRNCIKFEVKDDVSYENFWKPIQSLLLKNTQRIFLSVDGVYNQLNLEAISTPDNGYIIDKQNIILVSNTRDLIDRMLVTKRRTRKSKQVVFNAQGNYTINMFGNPTYYLNKSEGLLEKISQLPGSEIEVKQLNAMLLQNKWKSEVFLNEKATEKQIKEVASPKVLHIATHGFFMPDVVENDLDALSQKAIQDPLLRSGLLMANGGTLHESNNVFEFNKEEGILTANEAMNLNLDSTELVVLSACETGLGEIKLGEGVYGLQRSFMVAGANAIVMSLFKVSDEVTTDLMARFYKNWIQGGDKRKAFADAKREIKEKYNSPKLWGAFLMVGVE